MVRKTVLPNGIKLVTTKIPLSHVVSLGIWINSGSRDESKSLEGITHLFEHMLFKGTSKRSTKEIAKELDALGGYSNAFTTKENLCLYGKVMDKHLPSLVDIFLDLLLNSRFDDEELERERQVIIEEINMVEDYPEDLTHTVFTEKFWKDHPLGHPICGYRETLLSISRESLLEFKEKIIHPEQLIVSAAGNVEHEDFVALLTPYLGKLQPNGRGREDRTKPTSNFFKEAVYKKLEQIHLCMGIPAVSIKDPAKYIFYIFNMIFGSSMSSRLFQAVREKKGLAYAIYSFLNLYEDSGMFGIYAAVDPAKIEELLKTIKEEFLKIITEGIADEELARAKDYLIGSIYLNIDSTDSYMNRIAKNEIIYGKEIPLEEVEASILKITSEDIDRWLKGLPLPKDFSVLLLGPVRNKTFEKACKILE